MQPEVKKDSSTTSFNFAKIPPKNKKSRFLSKLDDYKEFDSKQLTQE